MSSDANKQTFEKLVRPHFDRLYRLAFRLTGRRAEAEDLFQDLLRSRMHTVEEGFLPAEGLDGFPGDQDPVRDNQRLEQLRSLDLALAKLSDEHRIVVLLHDTEGYKIDEIHELTGTPVGTVKSRLHRARARLREILTDDGTFS
jgi:RNA polymerase sigma-70 factor (ECF subfamily)